MRNCVLTHTNGSTQSFDLTLSPVATERGVVVAISIREPVDKYQQTRLFRALLEAAPDGMVIVDREGQIVLVNAQVEELFGYERSELIGQQVRSWCRTASPACTWPSAAASSASRAPARWVWPATCYARRKDGSEFPVEVTLSPLETEDGLLVSAAVRDISERPPDAGARPTASRTSSSPPSPTSCARR